MGVGEFLKSREIQNIKKWTHIATNDNITAIIWRKGNMQNIRKTDDWSGMVKIHQQKSRNKILDQLMLIKVNEQQ